MTLDNETQQDLHLIYTTSVEDIRFAKKQQWQMVYYALILMGAIFYLKLHLQLDSFWILILRIAIFMIAAIAIYMIIKIDHDLVGYRFTMTQVRGCLSQEFIAIRKIAPNYLKDKFYIKGIPIPIPPYKMSYSLAQMATIAATAIILISIPSMLKP
jgi:hypothetical protein